MKPYNTQGEFPVGLVILLAIAILSSFLIWLFETLN